MSYEVEYHHLVVRDDIPKLDHVVKLRIKSAIERKLMTQPEIFGVPLRHSTRGHRKLRVGDHRVVFRIEGMKVQVIIIQHRSVVYKMLADRLIR
ncbi:type II toxin-antitoxin system RelE/ParE family toxin [Patescibacteria group bacterium]|nr:MAG: type II toxin-antitoxin system RelE/ParE family toxin [Patescibacteria group bacterium]